MTFQKTAGPQVFTSKDDVPKDAIFVDKFTEALWELFFIDNPGLPKKSDESKKLLSKFLQAGHSGIWIYYPWIKTAVQTLPENLYFKLRTARNKNLINEKEQASYRNCKIGIAGLSVGSSILNALVMSGGPKNIKIADPDIVEISNLNRIKAGLPEVGLNKAEVAARAVWELDPFAKIELWPEGITENTIRDFMISAPRLNVFIEQMDNLSLKFFSRFVCREEKIPVLMATDHGEGVILDIERFDEEPDRPVFHGKVGEMRDYKDLEKLKNADLKQWLELADRIIGPENHSERLKESLAEIGKSLAGVPQLGPSAQLAGTAVSYVVRKIANGEKMPSGRYIINLDDMF